MTCSTAALSFGARVRHLAGIALILTLAACGGGGGGGGESPSPGTGSGGSGDSGGNPPPAGGVVTEVGTPMTEPMTSAVVGPAGGTLQSSARDITVIIPAGALAEDTLISITEITATGPGGGKSAWRLGPHGIQFSKPVTLMFNYAEIAAASGPQFKAEERMFVAFQNGDGTWSKLDSPTADTTNRMLSVQTTHFSDYYLGAYYQLDPPYGRVTSRSTVYLHLQSCDPFEGCVGEVDVDGWELRRYDGQLPEPGDQTYGTLVKWDPKTGAYIAPEQVLPYPRNRVLICAIHNTLNGGGQQATCGDFSVANTPLLKFQGTGGSISGYAQYLTIKFDDVVTLLSPLEMPAGIYGNDSFEMPPVNHAPIPYTMRLTNSKTAIDEITDTRPNCMKPRIVNGAGALEAGHYTQLIISDTLTLAGFADLPGIEMGSRDPKKNCLTDVEVIPGGRVAVPMTLSRTFAQLQADLNKSGVAHAYSRSGDIFWSWTIAPER